MSARFGRFALVLALAAGLAAVLPVPADAQQYPPPAHEDVLHPEVRAVPEP